MICFLYGILVTDMNNKTNTNGDIFQDTQDTPKPKIVSNHQNTVFLPVYEHQWPSLLWTRHSERLKINKIENITIYHA